LGVVKHGPASSRSCSLTARHVVATKLQYVVIIIEFEWDPAKAASNLKKHGVPSPYATRVFLDPHRLDNIDRRRSYGEERRLTTGAIDGRVYGICRKFPFVHQFGYDLPGHP
jgi:uncharacterized DUF497 family protein